ncbi:MAG: phosphoglycerate dehydrogenase [Dehalococcoidia bacterium]
MTDRVLVADPIAPEGLAALKEQVDVDVRTGLTPAELLAAIADYDALIVRSETRVTRDVIEAAANLRVIGRAGVGVDNIDVDAATDRGILVVNAPAGNTISAAELAVALLLTLSRHVAAADASLRGGTWDRKAYLGVELRGKTVGVVGLGQVGSAVARRLNAMEMTVIAHDPFIPDERARVLGVELTSLDDLLRRSDFVTLHTTLQPGAPPLIGRDQLALMKPSARLVNTARGGLVDEVALLEALDSRHIAGAAIDVFAQEPAANNPLVRHPSVVCTPHLGASTQEAQERVALDIAREILQVLDGQPATTAVNAPFVDPETLEIVGPYLAVAEMTGALTTQLAEGQWQSIRLEYQGDIANRDVTALRAAAVAGLLSTISEERVNLVSVNNIIAQRGWRLTEEMHHDAGLYSNLVTVRITTSSGSVCVSGTLAHGVPHIVEIDGFRVDVARDDHHPGHGHILILHNEDRPGRVGAVGTALGRLGVNISGMDVGKRDQTGHAIMVLTVDRALSPEELQTIGTIPGIEAVKQAEL